MTAQADLTNQKINAKVRDHSLAHVPVLAVVGRKEAENGTVALRRLGSPAQEIVPLAEAVTRLTGPLRDRNRERDDLAAAWRALHGGLLDSGGMAGGDEAGAAFAADYDVMAAAAWQGWRHSLLMLDGIAGGLAATGNNLAEAEADSTPGRRRPFTAIRASTTPVPAPALPPPAGGGGTNPVAESLLANGFMPLVDLSEPAACGARRPSAAGAAPHCAGGPTAGS